jgi:hypothetical protein
MKGLPQGLIMKTVNYYPVLALLILAASCNEKISSEIQNANATVGVPTTPTTPAATEYYFSVENASSPLLNYKLHRTGNTRYNTDCKISSTGVNFSNDLYVAEANSSPAIPHDSKTFDISCFMEAEELSLAMNGLKFDVKASPNTCDYIGYAPYSFYDRIPGDSTTTYTKVTCDAAISAATATTYLTTNKASLDSAGYPVGFGSSPTIATCNNYVDATLSEAERLVQIIADEKELCRFDYSAQTATAGRQAGANCDIGEITINEILISKDATTGNPVHKVTRTRRTCGGAIAGCVQGAIRKEATLGTVTSGTIMMDVPEDVAFLKNYSYAGNLTNRISSVEYANHRAQMGALEIDYISFVDAMFASIWPTDASRKQFDPNVMEYYSKNKMVLKSSLPLVSAAEVTAANKVNGYFARPYAAEPFVGLYGFTTNPFYTFICYDHAFDVKGKIRMVVRDWDRTFNALSTGRETELISDYYNDGVRNLTSRQDNPDEFEVIGDPGAFNSFNDRDDWDNKIPMKRTPGNFIQGTTRWEPNSLFFNPSNFTQGYY